MNYSMLSNNNNKMTRIYIDEKMGYCELNEKTENEIKSYIIDKICSIDWEIGGSGNKLAAINNIKETHKNLTITELIIILNDYERNYKRFFIN